MKKISVVYWSGTGNTEEMANLISEAARSESTEVNCYPVGNVQVNDILDSDILVLGCPAMGVEELEEYEFEPFMQELEAAGLSQRKLALFGSFGWGDGEWLNSWEDRVKDQGAELVIPSLAICYSPDDEGCKQCHQLGQYLIKA